MSYLIEELACFDNINPLFFARVSLFCGELLLILQ